MKKSIKITAISLASVLVILAIVAMILFIPLKGKPHDEVWAYSDEFDINKITTLEKTPNKDFKIMQLTDTQLWFLGSDNKEAFKIIKDLAESEKPDLFILTGDNVSGLNTDALLKKLIKTMDSLEIPWAPIFGNHDSEGKATLNWQGDRFMESKFCLFKKGPSNLYGVGNYVINIQENNKIIQSLFLFDNGRYYDYPTGRKEIYMGYEQMAWYQWNIEGIAKKAGEVVPSMTFSHFAIPEFKIAMETLTKKASDDRYYVPEELGFGSCAYLPGVAPVNSGFFQLSKKLKSTHSMFFGHDHENDASIKYEGITLTYGLKTGPSPEPWNDAKEYGGTNIIINSKNEVSIKHVVHSKA